MFTQKTLLENQNNDETKNDQTRNTAQESAHDIERQTEETKPTTIQRIELLLLLFLLMECRVTR